MANIKSAAKRAQIAKVRTLRNKSAMSKVKTTIKGVEASFVALVQNKNVNISARSFGKVNVQVVMELLGGGGHQTMAAAQIEYTDEKQLIDVISDAMKKAKENS